MITTIERALETAENGFITVDGKDVFCMGLSVLRYADNGSTKLFPHTEVYYSGKGDEYFAHDVTSMYRTLTVTQLRDMARSEGKGTGYSVALARKEELIDLLEGKIAALPDRNPTRATRPTAASNASASRAANYMQLMEDCAAYVAAERPRLGSAESVYNLLKPLFTEPKEMFFTLCLDAKNRLIEGPDLISIGTATASPANPREILRPAIIKNAVAIIVAHNHPSGDPTPSTADIRVTKQLKKACDVMGIKLLDHIVIGQHTADRVGWVSMRQQQLCKFD